MKQSCLLSLIEYQNKKTSIDSLSMTYIREDHSQFIKIDIDGRPKHLDLEIIPAYDLINVEEYSKYGTIGSWSAFRKNVKIVLFCLIGVVEPNAHFAM